MGAMGLRGQEGHSLLHFAQVDRKKTSGVTLRDFKVLGKIMEEGKVTIYLVNVGQTFALPFGGKGSENNFPVPARHTVPDGVNPPWGVVCMIFLLKCRNAFFQLNSLTRSFIIAKANGITFLGPCFEKGFQKAQKLDIFSS